METPPKEGSEGYPEEQPDEVAGDGDRDDREADNKPDEAGRGDDGQATGNPRSAG